MSEQKTHAEIIAEMRDFADGQEKRNFYDCRYLGTDALRGWADISEAAHKRERGDAAKLREALEKVIEIANKEWDASRETSAMWEIWEICKAALAAPARNCDRFATVKEAAEAFARERQDMPHPCPDFTFSRWLLTPVKKEGGAK